MKDIIIPGRRVVRELLIYAGCVLAALGVNAYAILRFKTEWQELITTFHITLAVAMLFYLVVAALRTMTLAVRRFRKLRISLEN